MGVWTNQLHLIDIYDAILRSILGRHLHIISDVISFLGPWIYIYIHLQCTMYKLPSTTYTALHPTFKALALTHLDELTTNHRSVFSLVTSEVNL